MCTREVLCPSVNMEIFGHKRQIAHLNKILKRGRMAHAFLFYGPEHVGKRTIAVALAKALYCPNARHNLLAVCGSCEACVRIEQGVHQNVFVLDSERTLTSRKEKRKEIPIEDIRELSRRFSYAPARGEWRLAIIDEAEKLSDEASNAFLKLLEEPGSHTLFILIARSRDALLPTIVSRAQHIGFSLVPVAECRAFLAARAPDASLHSDMLRIAGGRLGKLAAMVRDRDLFSEERKLLQDTYGIYEKRFLPDAFRLAERVSGNEERRNIFCEYLFRMLRERMMEERSGVALLAAVSVFKRLLRINEMLEGSNVNPRLALDAMCIEAMSFTGSGEKQ